MNSFVSRYAIIATVLVLVSSCTSTEPVEIRVNKDQCANCKMTITELNYASELVTSKGKTFAFDDIKCMDYFQNNHENEAIKNAISYVIDFNTLEFVKKNEAFLIQGGAIKSPMNGNIQAFKNKEDAQNAAQKLNAQPL